MMAYNPAKIVKAVLSLRPGLQVGVDFELADLKDGQGPFISAWHRGDVTQPTMTEVRAVDTDAIDAASREGQFDSNAERTDLLNRLRTATPAQINSYVDANVTNIAEARALFKKILLVLAKM